MSEHWLLIETSGRTGQVGLARGGAVVQTRHLDATRRHARDLAAVVGELLAAEGLKPGDVTGMMAGIGPGSYTGLRVGVMSAKALAYATGCRLIAVPTFAAIARLAPPEAREVWVTADALQGQVYLQRFTRHPQSGQLVSAGELRIDRADDVLPAAGAGVWLTGPGVKVYADRVPPHCRLVAEADREPTAESLFRAGLELAPASRAGLFALEPLYLRGSSAEEKVKREGPRG